MAVRVKLKIKGSSKEVSTSTLINSGFEAEEPQLVIPMSLAETLGMTSAEASIEDFSTAGGGRVSGYRVEELVEVKLVLEDRNPVKTLAHITILPGETEAIINERSPGDGIGRNNTGPMERILVPPG